MAHPRLRLRTSNCSLLLIYLPRKDERLSWPSSVNHKILRSSPIQLISNFLKTFSTFCHLIGYFAEIWTKSASSGTVNKQLGYKKFVIFSTKLASVFHHVIADHCQISFIPVDIWENGDRKKLFSTNSRGQPYTRCGTWPSTIKEHT